MKKLLLTITLLIGATSIDARQKLQDRYSGGPLKNETNSVNLAAQAQQLQDQEVALNAEQIARDEELNRAIEEVGLVTVIRLFLQNLELEDNQI